MECISFGAFFPQFSHRFSHSFRIPVLAPNRKEQTPLPARPTDRHRIASGLGKVKERSKGRRSPRSIARPIQNERTDGHARWRVSCTNIPPRLGPGPEVRDPNRDEMGKVRPDRPQNLGSGPGRIAQVVHIHGGIGRKTRLPDRSTSRRRRAVELREDLGTE